MADSAHLDHFIAGGKLAALVRDFAGRYECFSARPPTWVAVTSRGTFTHVLAAHDLDELRAKLEKSDKGACELIPTFLRADCPTSRDIPDQGKASPAARQAVHSRVDGEGIEPSGVDFARTEPDQSPPRCGAPTARVTSTDYAVGAPWRQAPRRDWYR